MSVDSFKYLPRIISLYYQRTKQVPELPIPWTPLKKRVENSTFALITSGGIYNKTTDEPFDVAREKTEPTWGDPTFRRIPIDSAQDELGVSHLHINTADILVDGNILLPIGRFRELVNQNSIGGLHENAYSFMGYQGFPPNTNDWKRSYGPQLAQELLADKVDCVFMTPA